MAAIERGHEEVKAAALVADPVAMAKPHGIAADGGPADANGGGDGEPDADDARGTAHRAVVAVAAGDGAGTFVLRGFGLIFRRG